MKHILLAFLLLNHIFVFSQETTYQKAWQALNKNNRAEAEKLLKQAMAQPNAGDAYITNLYLQTYNGKEKAVTDFENAFYLKENNPYPYIYALWFNDAVLGSYSKKALNHQLKIADRLMADQKANGTLAAAAGYQKLMHHIFSSEFDKVQSYASAIGNIHNWQFAGPFENLSESGFYKNYGPVGHPEPNAIFKSMSNADVTWFTPANEFKNGWTLIENHFDKSTAVVYAQSFINSPVDRTVICNAGFAGAIKVWINDELVISESKELQTEIDNNSIKYPLKKGTNRVLVQLSYTNTGSPYFSIRFTDEQFRVIPAITGSSVYSAYPKLSGNAREFEAIPHFAEKYFSEKIEAQPDNQLNYLLLADVYLRSRKLLEARTVLNTALEKAPENSLVRTKLLEVLAKESDRTLLLEELEKVKQYDPNSLLVMDLNISELYNNEKYEEFEEELKKRIKLHGEDETTAANLLMLLAHDKKYEDMVRLIEKLYADYPHNAEYVSMMYEVKKEVNQDKKGAMKVLERYMKSAYSHDVYMKYADALIEQGEIKKGIAVKDKLIQTFPYDPGGSYNLAKYFYGVKQWDKAEEYLGKSLSQAPYSEVLWELFGDIRSAKNNDAAAMEAYNMSLKLNPNQYNLISKIRKLNKLPEISKLFSEVDAVKIMEKDDATSAKNLDYGYYYIYDQKDVVIYPEGGSEEFISILFRITNEKGVERFKESSIGYDRGQTLLIEKAEIIKPNKNRMEGERNGNEVVFTNLEVGDVIYFRYRLQNYSSGRLGKEYWDKYFFNSPIYTAVTQYNLLTPANTKINYVLTNSSLQPQVKEVENFKLYSWVLEKAEPLKEEPLMPILVDAGVVLHVSTIPAWQEIANWYSDAVHNKSQENLEISSLYNSLFPQGTDKMTEYQKAKTIYDYIAANIRYSSVSFRQGALIPQRASATVTSRLGDCKDLSNLFVTLAHMAGINSQMVLIDTRDNGQKDIVLPSMDFNHCIAKAVLDNKTYYIELTDNYLPFASLPNNLNGALALEIPSKSVSEKAQLIQLKAANRVKDMVKRKILIQPQEDDLAISVETVKYGTASASTRYGFRNSNNEKQLQDMEQAIGGSYKNNVRVENIKFENLDELEDSVSYTYSFKVRNEINEIGSMKTFKIVYPDIVATLESFSADKRDYPVEYWNYEDIDMYDTDVTIKAPAGMKFMEVPKSETLQFKDMKYAIEYTLKAPDQLKVTRRFSHERAQQIAPQDYPAFRNFFEKIVKAEQKFIAYK